MMVAWSAMLPTVPEASCNFEELMQLEVISGLLKSVKKIPRLSPRQPAGCATVLSSRDESALVMLVRPATACSNERIPPFLSLSIEATVEDGNSMLALVSPCA